MKYQSPGIYASMVTVRFSQIPGLKEDYRSLNLHINIAELIMEGSGSPEFRRRWQAERAMLEGDDCFEVKWY